MQYYLLILIAVILLALQFSTNKAYSLRCGSSAKASLRFTALSGFASALVSLILAFAAGEGFRITPYSAVMAAIVAVLCCTYTFVGFKIMALGPMSVFTMFLMLGGMLLPYLFGVFFLDEGVSVWRILGVILLTASMAFPVLAREKSGTNHSRRAFVLFFLLCAAVFVLNGFVSITSKLHQINEVYARSGSASFSFLSNALNALISGAGLLIISAKEKSSASADDVSASEKAVHGAEKVRLGGITLIILANAVCGGVSYMLQLVSAGKVAASVLYPMITGGSMVLSALAAFLFFKEKPDKISLAGLALSFAATFLFLF